MVKNRYQAPEKKEFKEQIYALGINNNFLKMLLFNNDNIIFYFKQMKKVRMENKNLTKLLLEMSQIRLLLNNFSLGSGFPDKRKVINYINVK